MLGCRTPVARIESASSRKLESSKRVRGWCGLGSTCAIGISLVPVLWASSVLVPPEGMSASNPFPSAFLCMVHDLPRQFAITLSTGAVRIVQNDGLAKRGGFAETHVPRNHRLVHPLGEEFPRLVSDL